jgi:hypothetical protein
MSPRDGSTSTESFEVHYLVGEALDKGGTGWQGLREKVTSI